MYHYNMTLNNHYLDDTVTIQRHSASGVDDRGNLTSDWQDNQTDVKCRVIRNGSVEDRDGRNTIIESITIYFDDTVNVKANDRIKENSQFYEITGVYTARNAKSENCYTVISCLYRE